MTNDLKEAARGFRINITKDNDPNAQNMSEGQKAPYRYQYPCKDGKTAISSVALMLTEKPCNAPDVSSGCAYASENINSGRGGEHLYIIWGPASIL